MRSKFLFAIFTLSLLVSSLFVLHASSVDNGDHNTLNIITTDTSSPSIDQSPAPNSFESKWNTSITNSGSSANNQVTLPLQSTGTYDFTVDWGDGQSDIISTWDQVEVTHTYANEGEYNITIDGSIKGWKFNSAGDVEKLTQIFQWGDLNFGNEGAYFAGASNLELTAKDAPDLTGTTNMSSAFSNAHNLGDKGSMSTWNVSSVTDMSNLFYNASTFDQDLGSWDVS